MSFALNTIQSIADSIYSVIPQPRPSAEALTQVRIIAHRGDSSQNGLKENTIEAFAACQGKNIWAIEFDIRWTRDNVPVVHHDPTTQRVFAKNFELSRMTFEELRKELPEIPSLNEVVTRFAPELHLMIELKTDLTQTQEGKLKECLAALIPTEHFHIMSLNVNSFKNLCEFPKTTFVTIARVNTGYVLKETIENGYGAFTGHYLLFTNAIYRTCREKGLKVGTGFIDSKNLAYREINRGMDWLFTNRASQLAKICDADSKDYS